MHDYFQANTIFMLTGSKWCRTNLGKLLHYKIKYSHAMLWANKLIAKQYKIYNAILHVRIDVVNKFHKCYGVRAHVKRLAWSPYCYTIELKRPPRYRLLFLLMGKAGSCEPNSSRPKHRGKIGLKLEPFTAPQFLPIEAEWRIYVSVS